MKLLFALCSALPGLMSQEVAPTPSRPVGFVAPLIQEPHAPDRWNLHFQSTYIWQDKRPFNSLYSGENSLLPQRETGYSLTATLFMGVRLWSGAEVYFNPEMIQSQEISGLKGLGGLTNGENQKSGGTEAQVYRARLFLRQTWGLGGDVTPVQDGPNQLAGSVQARRLVLTVGNFAVMDVLDANTYSHDARTSFVNWAFLTHGAYDYAADARGYSWGAALEYFHDAWAFRFGRFAQPRESNGLELDNKVQSHFGDQVEVEHAHTIAGKPGKLRVLAFRNVARMGSFQDALTYSRASGGVPEVGNVRRNQTKSGFGIALEQSLTGDFGFFARGSWNDGKTETYAFTEIERSLSAGGSLKGSLWHRPDDTFGMAFAWNALSRAHRSYLEAGGLGAFIGDGRLSYAPEQITEAFYNFKGSQSIWLSAHAQALRNPAYNSDRGPVKVFGVRMHLEF